MQTLSSKEQREAQREAVKTLAIAVGVREAARQLGLSEERVMKWSQRDHWFPKIIPTQLPPTVTRNEVRTVRKPSDALRECLDDDNRETKLSLSKGVRRLAKHIETMPETILFAGADKVKQAVASASQIHSWDQIEEGSGVMSGLRVYSKQTVIQVKTNEDRAITSPD